MAVTVSKVLTCYFLFLSVIWVKALPVYKGHEDQDYLHMMAALERAKDAGYLGNWYSQLYETYDYPSLGYQDYVNDLLQQREWQKQMEQQMDENEPEEELESEEQLPMDLEVREDWPSPEVQLGQVSGVAVTSTGIPVVFHRANKVWGDGTRLFDDQNQYLDSENGPIKSATLLEMDPEDGTVLKEWGQNRFYLPHGLTIDPEGNYWLTDVALHQVFKFDSNEDKEPSLVLGEAFKPAEDNSDKQRFCKPADVAVSAKGQIFVADGYCNRRVVKFDENGSYLGQIDIVGVEDSVPHSVTLAEELDLICVADRENVRILCYKAGLQSPDEFGRLEREYTEPELGSIYAIEYNPATGLLFAVTGVTLTSRAIGFTLDLYQKQPEVIDEWSPHNQGFDQPHDVAVSPDGNTVYVGEIFPYRVWQFENEAEDLNDKEEEEDVKEVDQSSEEEKLKLDLGSDEEVIDEKDKIVETEELEDEAGNKVKVIKQEEVVGEEEEDEGEKEA